MTLKLITAPTSEPVTVTDAKAHLNVIGSDQDTLITAYTAAARQHLDGRDGILGRALMPQTWELVLDAFPCGAVRIPLPPLQSVTSIKYLDAAGVEQTLSTSAYAVDADGEPGWVSPVSTWPQTFPTINAVRIRFVAGYADETAVPKGLWAAILLMVGDLYENREAVTGDARAAYVDNPTVDRLIAPYRMLTL